MGLKPHFSLLALQQLISASETFSMDHELPYQSGLP